MLLELREQFADLCPGHGDRSWARAFRTRCLEPVFVFTVDSLGSVSVSTVVFGDAGPVTASGSGDIVTAPALTEECCSGVKAQNCSSLTLCSLGYSLK